MITGRGPKFEKLPERERGVFWSASCYMVLYSYTGKDEDGDPVQVRREKGEAYFVFFLLMCVCVWQRYRVYFWQGARAGNQWYPQFVFGFFPVLERRIKSQGRHVDSVHIHQGSEPKHFCMLFGAVLVVRNGERQEPAPEGEPLRNWQKQVRLVFVVLSVCCFVDEDLLDQPVMMDARLQMPSEVVRAVQPAELSAAFLHSEGTFVVCTGEQTFVWVGKASRLFPSHDAVKALLLRVGRGATVQLMEGDEEADFWAALGGPGRYCKKERRSQWVPRLFEGYAQNGQLKMREVVNYSQFDLSEKGSYLLDCYDKLYVWYGTQCSETMKQSSILVANTYIRLAATVREMYVGLELFMSGSEPLEFQWVFQAWAPRAISAAQKTQDRRQLRLQRLQLLEYRRLQLEEVSPCCWWWWFLILFDTAQSAATAPGRAVYRREQADQGEQRQAAREGRGGGQIQRQAARHARRRRQVREGKAGARAGPRRQGRGLQEGDGRDGGREREKEKGERRATQARGG